MKPSIYRDSLARIHREEQRVALETNNVIKESDTMRNFLLNLLEEMKKHVLEHGFSDEKEEIEFFRTIKPEILGKLIYYNKVYRIETSCPVHNGKFYHKFFSSELEELKQEYKEHICQSDFYRYFRSGRTDRDHTYFRLGRIDIHSGLNSYVFEIDPLFSTYYDYKVSKILANDLLYDYIVSKLTPEETEILADRSKHQKEFFWTESKAALIELIYALYVIGSISSGKVSIRKICAVFQVLFGIQLGDIHHAFHRMKEKAGSRTAFLDNLKIALEEYMNKSL